MLQATYATDRTVPIEKSVTFQEGRGSVRFSIHPGAGIGDVIRAMNGAADHLCHDRGWLQLWEGGVGALSLAFEIADLPGDLGVDIQETEGRILVLVDRRMTAREFAMAMNLMSVKVLAGGQLFQCWNGEIVSNASLTDGQGATLKA